MSNIENIILAPISDEHYAKRMRLAREFYRYLRKKYGKAAEDIALWNFGHLFLRKEVKA